MRFSTLFSVFICFFFFICSCFLIGAQQPYVGKTTTDCNNEHNSSSGLGYFCNGVNRTCQSYLTFRAVPPYNSVSAISDLLAADPSQVSEINSVPETATFDTNRLVIVPVNCACSGEYYQLNTSYVVKQDEGYYIISNSTFQGLTTCQAIGNQAGNPISNDLDVGQRISVPLRCACPRKNQTDLGVNYLVSYLVAKNDFLSGISERFEVDNDLLLSANGLSEQDSTIYPDTTFLVPLEKPPIRSQTVDPPPPPLSPPPPPGSPATSASSSNSSKKTWLYALIGALGGTAFLLVLGTIIYCRVFRKNKRKTDPVLVPKIFESGEKLVVKKGEESQDFLDSLSDIAQSIKVYKFEELQQATDDFGTSSLVKGSVYRGIIKGDFAAIKKVDGDISKEINSLQKINHSNVIRLSGVSFNEGYWYLVYEYAANGPLSGWIYHKRKDGKFLSWTQRIQIALDVATGLNYLHSFTTPSHVHKDIKSSNILLDSDFRAKIANFGLVRSTQGQDGQYSLTKHIVGTVGYMAPEYLENGLVSTKIDVYAFGVVLLEMLTGKEVSVLYEENSNLSDSFSAVLNDEGQDSLKHFMDPSMGEKYPSELVNFVVRIIDGCLKKNPEARPAMGEIVQLLSRTLSNSLNWESSNTFVA